MKVNMNGMKKSTTRKDKFLKSIALNIYASRSQGQRPVYVMSGKIVIDWLRIACSVRANSTTNFSIHINFLN